MLLTVLLTLPPVDDRRQCQQSMECRSDSVSARGGLIPFPPMLVQRIVASHLLFSPFSGVLDSRGSPQIELHQ